VAIQRITDGLQGCARSTVRLAFQNAGLDNPVTNRGENLNGGCILLLVPKSNFYEPE